MMDLKGPTMKSFAKRLVLLIVLIGLGMVSHTTARDCADATTDFGVASDGSPDTTDILAALAATETQCVYFGYGTFAFDPTNLPVFDFVPLIETAGLRNTTFKNLSTSSRMFEFEKHDMPQLKSSFLDFGGFTIDQNGSTGDAIRVKAMFPHLHDIWVYGQAGAGWAFNVETATQGVLTNLQATASSNCLRVYLTYYLQVDHFGCERTTGVGILVELAASISFNSTYLDHGSAAGPSAYELLKVVDSTANFYSLASEIGTAATLTPNWYFLVVDSTVNIFGGRLNHYSNHGSHYLFFVDGSSFRLQGFEWHESKYGMILVGGRGNIVARDIVTKGTFTGSRYGIANWAGQATRVEIENWQDFGTPASNAYVSAATTYIRP